MTNRVFLTRTLLIHLIKEMDRLDCDALEFEDKDLIEAISEANAKEGYLSGDNVIQ